MKRMFLLLTALLALLAQAQDERISLTGEWRLNDSAYVFLPGSLAENGVGERPNVATQWTGTLYDSSFYHNPFMAKYRTEENFKVPFFLTPKRRFVGQARLGRNVYIPKEWRKRRVTIFLERPHIETAVSVNGQHIGRCRSLSTPHEYDITEAVVFGERNRLEITVDNRTDSVGVGPDSHSVSDQTQGNWNGIVGRMELFSRPRDLSVDRVQVFPELERNRIQVVVNLTNFTEHNRIVLPLESPYSLMAWIQEAKTGKLVSRFQTQVHGQQMRFLMHFADTVRLWDQFHPNLYRLTVSTGDNSMSVTFGMRRVETAGRQLLVNGVPTFLRGTVESCCFPETGYPPTDLESWMSIMQKCKDYGLNHIRFHSWCPPEAAFDAADLLGIYLQIEGPTWPNHGVKLGNGQLIDTYLKEESERILTTYGNHPSFLIYALGNEPAGRWTDYARQFIDLWKPLDTRHIYCAASVGGGWAWDAASQIHVKGGARGLDWDKHAPHADDDFREMVVEGKGIAGRKDNPQTVEEPWVTHEMGQWCAFPDLDERPLYTGINQSGNLDIFADLLEENGMAGQARKFTEASGRLQTLCYKYDIERNLRTPDHTGFQLLGLNDYSGQGTATVGTLNVHWKEKPYTNRTHWRQFCNPLVLLARMPRFVYQQGDTLRAPLEAYNAFWGMLENVDISWRITDDSGQIVSETSLGLKNIPIGKNIPLGEIIVPLDTFSQPQKLTLTALLHHGLVSNQWDFWVYPRDTQTLETPEKPEKPDKQKQLNKLDKPEKLGKQKQLDKLDKPEKLDKLYLTDTLDQKAIEVLKRGGRVLIEAAGKVRFGSDVKQTYLPVFWNTSWFKMRPPHTTGSYIDRQHPMFRDFPTDSWQNLNWWELVNGAQVMNLSQFPRDYQPPFQPIDTWHVSRKLAMVIEAKVLRGRLLMTTFDLRTDLAHRHAARQLRRSIINYMQSDRFAPTLRLEPTQISHLFTHTAPPVNMFTTDSPDELKPKLK